MRYKFLVPYLLLHLVKSLFLVKGSSVIRSLCSQSPLTMSDIVSQTLFQGQRHQSVEVVHKVLQAVKRAFFRLSQSFIAFERVCSTKVQHTLSKFITTCICFRIFSNL